MKPIYFPYTFIPEEVAEAGAACFEQMIFLMPSDLDMPAQMTRCREKGWLDIFTPLKGDEARVRSVVREYKQWADTHADADGIRLAMQGPIRSQTPFYSESSIMKIREDIQRGIRKKDTVPDGLDPLFSSRVFLHMAHEFDMQHYAIHEELKRLDKMEDTLLSDLQGEAVHREGETMKAHHSGDPFDFMIQERVEAWSGCMLHHLDETNLSGLFVTGNRTVFSYITERISEGEMLTQIDNIPVEKDETEPMKNWRDALLERIQQLTMDPWPEAKVNIAHAAMKDNTGKRISLKLYAVPGKTPFDLFVRFCPSVQPELKERIKAGKITNTLIALLDLSL